MYSIVENDGINSAGWCCSDMAAYWGGNYKNKYNVLKIFAGKRYTNWWQNSQHLDVEYLLDFFGNKNCKPIVLPYNQLGIVDSIWLYSYFECIKQDHIVLEASLVVLLKVDTNMLKELLILLLQFG